MSVGDQFQYINNRIIDSRGLAVGSQVYFYLTGTTTLTTVYADAALTTPIANPYTVNAGAAIPNIYLDPSITYRVRIVGSTGQVIDDLDPYDPLTASNFNFIQLGTGAVTRTSQDKMRERMTLADFGGVGNNVTNNASAMAAALTRSYADRNRPIRMTSGEYLFSSGVTITQGVAILGDGSQGSTEQYGTTMKHAGAGDFLTWDGAGATVAGTGGGIRDMLIVKADTYTTGTAITVKTTDALHRPGELWLSNILIYGVGNAPAPGLGTGGLWEHCLVIDGSTVAVPGIAGVRSFYGFKIRCSEATTTNETVVINTVSHFFIFGLQIDQGEALAVQGLTIRGLNDCLCIYGLDVSGNLVIDNDVHPVNPLLSSKIGLVIDGKLGGSFTNNDLLAEGNVTLHMSSAYVLLNKSPRLSIRCNLSPAFKITANTPSANDKTGDGTVYVVPFDTEVYDNGNNITVPANTYVCACAGLTRFKAQITLQNIAAGHTRLDFSIVRTGSATTTITKVIPLTAVSGFSTHDISADLVLAYADQVKIQVQVSGSTKTVGIYGNGVSTFTLFEGRYVG
jgi:hypothetical protein